eukprot:5311000-Pleurochrysis_carterae.AAC.1
MKGAGEEETDVYNRREEKGLNKEERIRERKRNQVFKWSLMMVRCVVVVSVVVVRLMPGSHGRCALVLVTPERQLERVSVDVRTVPCPSEPVVARVPRAAGVHRVRDRVPVLGHTE